MTGTDGLPGLLGRLPKTRAALEYAERQHAGQERSSDGAAFIEHPREVGWLLYRAGAPDHLIAAGVLHDVVEKTAATPSELAARFGSRVTKVVIAVSEDQGIRGYTGRKAALRQQVADAGREAWLLFAADKVSKVRELRHAIGTAIGEGDRVDESLVRPRRLAHYRHCLGMLEERLGDAPLVELLRTELGELGRELKRYKQIPALA